MLRHIAGITPVEPGYAGVKVAPVLPNGVDWVDAEIETIRGPIRVAARRRRSKVDVEVYVAKGIAAV